MVHFIALYSTDEKASEKDSERREREREKMLRVVSTSIAAVVAVVAAAVKVAGMQKKGRGHRISTETRELRESTRARRGLLIRRRRAHSRGCLSNFYAVTHA